MRIRSILSRLPLGPRDFLFEKFLGVRFNDGMEQAAVELESLLNESTRDVKIIAGNIERGLFTRPEVLNAFDGALGRGVTIRVVCGSDVGPKGAAFFELADRSEGLEVRKSEGYPPLHYIIVDNNRTFVEEYHEPGEMERHGVTVDGEVGPLLSLDFEDQWKATPSR